MARDKIKKLVQMKKELKGLRSRGKRVVFTNGCFDLLHPGHLRVLKEAKEHGDSLVVGINSDRSARALKGSDRPFVDEEARAEVVAAIEWVDYVVVFDEDTPLRLLETLKPEVLVKGGDYTLDEVVGADLVRNYGGEVVTTSAAEGYSTSCLISRIQGHEKK